MSAERLDRFAANVDMMGEIHEESRTPRVLEASSPVSGVSETVRQTLYCLPTPMGS